MIKALMGAPDWMSRTRSVYQRILAELKNVIDRLPQEGQEEVMAVLGRRYWSQLHSMLCTLYGERSIVERSVETVERELDSRMASVGSLTSPAERHEQSIVNRVLKMLVEERKRQLEPQRPAATGSPPSHSR